jgi:3,4-dihydroxy 2-butanone 4-phosphate synthase/GTP cyclohydrolase II
MADPARQARWGAGDGVAPDAVVGSGARGPVTWPADDVVLRLRTRLARRSSAPVGRPFVTLTYAQSLDGSIAAVRGRPLALSGREARVMTHRLRAEHGAILVGIGTVLSDDPRLTVRHVAGAHPRPIVLDSRLRTPTGAALLRHPTHRPVLATTAAADASREALCEAAGARVVRFPSDERGRVSLEAVVGWLGEEGVESLMVEGGARVITSFLRARLVDHVLLTVVSVFIGGVRAVGPLGAGRSDAAVSRLPRLRNVRTFRAGRDLVLSGDPVWAEG